jgi:hypothetical protein
MSLKWLNVLVLVAAATLVAQARAQNNELSGLIGRTFISDQGIKGVVPSNAAVRFGAGLTFEINYARRIMGTPLASLSVEVPFLANLDEDLNADVFLVPKEFKSYFVTPAARLNVFANQAVSPWISFGGGFGHFDESSRQLGGAHNTNTGTNTGVLQAGVGLDVRVFKRFSMRGEFRDFWSGTPQLNVDTGKSRQHNFFVGGGVVWHF